MRTTQQVALQSFVILSYDTEIINSKNSGRRCIWRENSKVINKLKKKK